MKVESKSLKVLLLIAAVVTLSGIGLFIAGFMVPPLGVIDSSVLTAGGEAFTFAGAILGVDYSYRFKSLVVRSGNK